jgi:ribosomal protein S1
LLPGSRLDVLIYKIEKDTLRVTVKLPIDRKPLQLVKPTSRVSFWASNISKVRRNGRYKGVVKSRVQFGYFILLECGLQGLLHISQVKRNQQFKENEHLEVIVLNIDNNKKQIELGI